MTKLRRNQCRNLCFTVFIFSRYREIFHRIELRPMEVGQDYSDDYEGPGLDSYKTQIIVPKTYSGQEVRVYKLP